MSVANILTVCPGEKKKKKKRKILIAFGAMIADMHSNKKFNQNIT